MRQIKLLSLFVVIFFLTATFFLFAGGPKEKEKIYKIGYASHYLGDSFMVSVQEGFKEAAKKYPNVKMVYGDCEDNSETGLKVIDNFISQKVDVIIILAWLGVEDKIAEKARNANIPLICIDVDYGEGTYFFGLNNMGTGRATGEMLTEWAKENWPGKKYDLVFGVELISGEIVYERREGALEKLKEGLGEKNILSITDLDTDTDQELALKMFSEYLTAHPDSHNILVSTLNDEAAIGYWKASQQQNRLKDVAICGIGCDEAGIKTMLAPDTNYIGAVATFPEKDGEFCLKIALDLLNGKKLERYTFGPYAKVTPKNLKDYYPQYVK